MFASHVRKGFPEETSWRIIWKESMLKSSWNIKGHLLHMGESFQDYSWIQDFEDGFPQKVILKMLN